MHDAFLGRARGEPARPDATARLIVTLYGPLDLHGVAVAIRDDRPDRAPGIAGGPSAAEIAATVWGPWRFRHGVDGATPDGRAVPARPLHRRGQLVFVLDAAPVPSWTLPDHWVRDHADAALRLTITCTREATRRGSCTRTSARNPPRRITLADPRSAGPSRTARWRAGERVPLHIMTVIVWFDQAVVDGDRGAPGGRKSGSDIPGR